MQKKVNELQGIGGKEATTALYGKPSTITDRAFEAMPENYMEALRPIMLSLEHRPDLLSLDRFFVAVNLDTRSMRPARTLGAMQEATKDKFSVGLRFDKSGSLWSVTDLATNKVIHSPDVFSETINY